MQQQQPGLVRRDPVAPHAGIRDRQGPPLPDQPGEGLRRRALTAQDVDETHEHRRRAPLGGGDPQHRLDQALRRPVEAGRVDGLIRRGVDQPAHAGLARGFEHVLRPEHVRGGEGLRVLLAPGDVLVGGQMEDQVRALRGEQAVQAPPVAHVAEHRPLLDVRGRGAQRLAQPEEAALVLVVEHQARRAGGGQGPGQRGPERASGPGDEHRLPPHPGGHGRPVDGDRRAPGDGVPVDPRSGRRLRADSRSGGGRWLLFGVLAGVHRSPATGRWSV